MKHILRFMMMFALSAAVLCGCSKREMMAGMGDIDADGNSIGYVRLAGLGLSVELDGERVNYTEQGASTTRAALPTEDDLNIEIVDAETDMPVAVTLGEGNTAERFTYAQLRAAEDGVVALPLGKYYVRAFSGSSFEVEGTVFWENENGGQPSYAGVSEPFVIEKKHTKEAPLTQAVSVVCTLQTVKVTVVMEQGLAARLKGDQTTVTVVLAGTDTYDANDSRNREAKYNNDPAGHCYGLASFTPVSSDKVSDADITRESAVSYMTTVSEEDNSMFVLIKSKFIVHADDPDDVSDLDTQLRIAGFEDGLKAGQWRKIWLYLDNVDEQTGRVTIGVRIENWVYDQEVTVDVTETVARIGQKGIPDYSPAKLSIFSDGDLKFGEENTVSSFNAAGEYTGNAHVGIRLNTGAALSKFAIRVKTGNSGFAADLRELAMTDWVNVDSDVKSVRNQLTLWGFPEKIGGAESFGFDLGGFLKDAFTYGNGTHTIEFDIESNGYYYRDFLTVNVKTGGGSDEPSGDGPSIVWDGYDFGTRYNTNTPNLSVAIEIAAPAGIKSLLVKMSGEIEAGLTGLMPTEFDLAHTSEADFDGDLGATLSGDPFYFPVDDDVVGSTSLTFDITGFMGMLSVFPGDTDFQLTVIDRNGESVTRTIQLHVDEQ